MGELSMYSGPFEDSLKHFHNESLGILDNDNLKKSLSYNFRTNSKNKIFHENLVKQYSEKNNNYEIMQGKQANYYRNNLNSPNHFKQEIHKAKSENQEDLRFRTQKETQMFNETNNCQNIRIEKFDQKSEYTVNESNSALEISDPIDSVMQQIDPKIPSVFGKSKNLKRRLDYVHKRIKSTDEAVTQQSRSVINEFSRFDHLKREKIDSKRYSEDSYNVSHNKFLKENDDNRQIGNTNFKLPSNSNIKLFSKNIEANDPICGFNEYEVEFKENLWESSLLNSKLHIKKPTSKYITTDSYSKQGVNNGRFNFDSDFLKRISNSTLDASQLTNQINKSINLISKEYYRQSEKPSHSIYNTESYDKDKETIQLNTINQHNPLKPALYKNLSSTSNLSKNELFNLNQQIKENINSDESDQSAKNTPVLCKSLQNSKSQSRELLSYKKYTEKSINYEKNEKNVNMQASLDSYEQICDENDYENLKALENSHKQLQNASQKNQLLTSNKLYDTSDYNASNFLETGSLNTESNSHVSRNNVPDKNFYQYSTSKNNETDQHRHEEKIFELLPKRSSYKNVFSKKSLSELPNHSLKRTSYQTNEHGILSNLKSTLLNDINYNVTKVEKCASGIFEDKKLKNHSSVQKEVPLRRSNSCTAPTMCKNPTIHKNNRRINNSIPLKNSSPNNVFYSTSSITKEILKISNDGDNEFKYNLSDQPSIMNSQYTETQQTNTQFSLLNTKNTLDGINETIEKITHVDTENMIDKVLNKIAGGAESLIPLLHRSLLLNMHLLSLLAEKQNDFQDCHSKIEATLIQIFGTSENLFSSTKENSIQYNLNKNLADTKNSHSNASFLPNKTLNSMNVTKSETGYTSEKDTFNYQTSSQLQATFGSDSLKNTQLSETAYLNESPVYSEHNLSSQQPTEKPTCIDGEQLAKSPHSYTQNKRIDTEGHTMPSLPLSNNSYSIYPEISEYPKIVSCPKIDHTRYSASRIDSNSQLDYNKNKYQYTKQNNLLSNPTKSTELQVNSSLFSKPSLNYESTPFKHSFFQKPLVSNEQLQKNDVLINPNFPLDVSNINSQTDELISQEIPEKYPYYKPGQRLSISDDCYLNQPCMFDILTDRIPVSGLTGKINNLASKGSKRKKTVELEIEDSLPVNPFIPKKHLNKKLSVFKTTSIALRKRSSDQIPKLNEPLKNRVVIPRCPPSPMRGFTKDTIPSFTVPPPLSTQARQTSNNGITLYNSPSCTRNNYKLYKEKGGDYISKIYNTRNSQQSVQQQQQQIQQQDVLLGSSSFILGSSPKSRPPLMEPSYPVPLLKPRGISWQNEANNPTRLLMPRL